MKKDKITFRPSWKERILLLVSLLCSGFMIYVGCRVSWTIDYEVRSTPISEEATEEDPRKIPFDIQVYKEFDGMHGLPLIVIALFLLILSIELFERKIEMDESELYSRSILGIYRKKLHIARVSGARLTPVPRFSNIVEIKYDDRWIVFPSNSNFKGEIARGLFDSSATNI